MERQHIIFNLDDTLVECNKYFNRVITRFTQEMSAWFEGVSPDAVRQKQLEIDLKQVDLNGLTTEHFPQSFVHTYEALCAEKGTAPDPGKVRHLEELGNSVFEIPVEPLPDMYETLEILKHQGHELYIHTGGVEVNQRRKIAQLQLAAYFDNRVFISLHKDVHALDKILRLLPADTGSVWMVGNSPKTDIIPALELGVNAIYIPAQAEWSYNLVEITTKPKAAFLTLRALKEVPGAIESYWNEKAGIATAQKYESAPEGAHHYF